MDFRSKARGQCYKTFFSSSLMGEGKTTVCFSGHFRNFSWGNSLFKPSDGVVTLTELPFLFFLVQLICFLCKLTVKNRNGTGNTKGGSFTALLTSCLTGFELAVRLLTNFNFICKTD